MIGAEKCEVVWSQSQTPERIGVVLVFTANPQTEFVQEVRRNPHLFFRRIDRIRTPAKNWFNGKIVQFACKLELLYCFLFFYVR